MPEFDRSRLASHRCAINISRGGRLFLRRIQSVKVQFKLPGCSPCEELISDKSRYVRRDTLKYEIMLWNYRGTRRESYSCKLDKTALGRKKQQIQIFIHIPLSSGMYVRIYSLPFSFLLPFAHSSIRTFHAEMKKREAPATAARINRHEETEFRRSCIRGMPRKTRLYSSRNLSAISTSALLYARSDRQLRLNRLKELPAAGRSVEVKPARLNEINQRFTAARQPRGSFEP